MYVQTLPCAKLGKKARQAGRKRQWRRVEKKPSKNRLAGWPGTAPCFPAANKVPA